MNSFFNKQIEEISRSSALMYYGCFLSLIHVWSFLFWNRNNFFVYSQSSSNSEPLCFPFFPNCDLWRSAIPINVWQWLLYGYLIIACLAAVLFLKRTTLKRGYFLLLIATLIKLVFHLSNYNFMGNYHYMAHWIVLVFLFLPHKIILSQVMIVLFYFAAGLLKLNIDWLSGAAMISTPMLSGDLLFYSLIYVLFLELIFAFGLIHSNLKVRLFCLLQFIAFHIFSWHIVGFFYPMVMFSLLSIFVLPLIFKENYHSQLWRSKAAVSTITIFILMQALPFLLVKDPSLSGVARLSSLNMFDSRTTCQNILVGKTQQGSIHFTGQMKNLGVRLGCDPIVILNRAHQLCRKNQETKEIKELNLHLYSKRITDNDYKKVLSLNNLCNLSNPLWGELLGDQG